MVNIKLIQESNRGVSALPANLVAVFIGATSGIAEAALKQFTQNAVEPKIYIVGRNAASSALLLEDLRTRNPKAVIEFIEKDASLVSDIDAACAIVKAKEQRVDLLSLSAGFISFSGRQGMLNFQAR
jgi:NADP-dependent 3-hydroxy acid dehydrogenase YdfG